MGGIVMEENNEVQQRVTLINMILSHLQMLIADEFMFEKENIKTVEDAQKMVHDQIVLMMEKVREGK